MTRQWLTSIAICLATICQGFAQPDDAEPTESATRPGPAKVFVIPIREEIGKTELFILRRGLKSAITEEADTVILNMETPGGRLDITLEMMEALDKFPGKKITFVNDEAISAGAIIASVTDEIHFSPKATIGAAEVIMGTGQDVSEGLKRKLNSYMGAKIRSYSGDNPTRADVIRAMMDPDFEFKIGDTVIKPKDELLSLTATEAMTPYGEPAQPLLGSGISEDLDSLISSLHGTDAEVSKLEVTWSEKTARYLAAITPILIALGMLALFVEFKTPGFGVFGVVGAILMGTVFLGQYVAGLSGQEPILFFFLGALLVALEVLLFPGLLIGFITGALLMFGSLLWAMLDHWPNEPLPTLDGDALTIPLAQILGGFLIAIFLFIAIVRFLPNAGPFGRMVLQTSIAGEPVIGAPITTAPSAPKGRNLVGLSGRAATALFPSGQIEIDGHRYEARLAVGSADAGTPIKVTKATEFALIVEVLS